MDRYDLLDSKASNRYLRAYALLAAEYSGGARSAIDGLLPFCKKAVQHFAGNLFDPQKLRTYIEITYRVHIPLYMLDAFKGRLLEAGFLKQDPSSSAVLICQSVESEEVPSSATSLSAEDLQLIEMRLGEFAERAGLSSPLASENWSEAIINFFSGEGYNSAGKIKKVNNQLISDTKRIDDYVVSEFLSNLREASSGLYEVAKKLYYGVIVADFYSCFNELSNAGDLNGVAFVLDTTLLMRLLGTSGRLLQQATSELVDDVTSLGGSVYYFHHIYEELSENINAIIAGIENGGDVFRETQQAISNREISSSDIKMLPSELDIRLGKAGVTQSEFRYKRGDNLHQIDEDGFAQLIGGQRYLTHKNRWDRDAQSLAMIMRLRAGIHPTKLADCRAILVTHNGALARSARDFLSDGGTSKFDIPPILTADQVSVLSWLAKGTIISDEKLSAKLAASCYEARIPKEGWEREFWDKLKKLEESSEDCRELLLNQFVQHSMRDAVLDRTFGEPSLTRTLDLESILNDVHKGVEEARERNRDQALGEGALGERNAIDRLSRQRCKKWGVMISSIIFGLIFVATSLCYLAASIYTFVHPSKIGISAYINLAFSTVLSLLAVASIFGFIPRVESIKERFGEFLANWLYSILYSSVIPTEKERS